MVASDAVHGMSATEGAAASITQFAHWVEAQGPPGLFAFAGVHAAAVIVCFPATILFDLAAGFLFGMVTGTALVWCAKVVAATFTFLLSSGLLRAALIACGVADRASQAFASQPRLARLVGNIESNGARYTLLARLSPIPSWVNNYGLAFAGVKFADYLPVTAIATLPTVLTNVYTGSVLSSLVGLTDDHPMTLASKLLAGSVQRHGLGHEDGLEHDHGRRVHASPTWPVLSFIPSLTPILSHG